LAAEQSVELEIIGVIKGGMGPLHGLYLFVLAFNRARKVAMSFL
jgi:hypothetical protein